MSSDGNGQHVLTKQLFSAGPLASCLCFPLVEILSSSYHLASSPVCSVTLLSMASFMVQKAQMFHLLGCLFSVELKSPDLCRGQLALSPVLFLGPQEDCAYGS